MQTFEDAVKKNISLEIPEMVKNFRFNFKQSDNFIAWITGFDIAGISLIIANQGKLVSILGRTDKIIVTLLFTSIICGVIYRIMSISLLPRIQHFELNFRIFTTSSTDGEDAEDELKDDPFLPKFNSFMKESLGLTDKNMEFSKSLLEKKVYPRAYHVARFLYGSLFLFIIALIILVFDYIF